jgi:hypothetical protein
MVKRVEKKLSGVAVGKFAAIAVMALSAGCSAGGEPQSGENVGMSQDATSEASCATVTPSASYTGGYSIVSPGSYNKCTKTYVVDVSNLSSEYTGTGNCGDAGFDVGYGGSALSPTDCVNTELRSIMYHQVSGSWVVMHDDDVFGVVGPFNECMLSFRQTGTVTGNSYRIAATSRDVNGNTLPLAIATVPRCVIQ